MAGLSEVSRGHSTIKWEGPNNRRFLSLKDTKKYKESRQLPKGGYLHKDRVEPESSAGAPSISSMSQNKENNVN
ncbi:MAG: hypothetical protein K8R58_14270, partial [Bacteroidales bacterium]|nr:hypothetical protein [Bacteroidales bacterium]